MRPSVRRLTVGAISAIGLAGCGLVSQLHGSSGIATRRFAPPASAIAPDLALISRLPEEDPGRQAEHFQAVKDAAELTPTTSNRLRYALALATPGQSGSDAVAAERQLSQILARPETLLPEERMLAMVELKQVEQRLILQAENERLREQVDDTVRVELKDAKRRLAAESAQNARLRKALQDAEDKIEAVSHLERAINDRATGGSTPP